MDHGGDKRAAAKTQHEYEKQQFYQQQQLFLQQLQRPQVATPRFPFNIDPRLRPQHHLLHHRPLNPSSSVSAQRIVSNPSALRPNHPNPPVVPINNPIPQQHKLSKQLAYEDAERICHPDFKRPFTSLGDACERFRLPVLSLSHLFLLLYIFRIDFSFMGFYRQELFYMFHVFSLYYLYGHMLVRFVPSPFPCKLCIYICHLILQDNVRHCCITVILLGFAKLNS